MYLYTVVWRDEVPVTLGAWGQLLRFFLALISDSRLRGKGCGREGDGVARRDKGWNEGERGEIDCHREFPNFLAGV